jgi:hypothetical protein
VRHSRCLRCPVQHSPFVALVSLCVAIVEELSHGPRATALDLAGNAFTARGAAALSRALFGMAARGSPVRSLGMRGNPLCDAGVVALARGLPDTVSSLDVSDTGLQHGGWCVCVHHGVCVCMCVCVCRMRACL